MSPAADGLAITVLGCDGSYPGPGGAASGYLLTCEGCSVWLDAGSGTLANLQRHVRLEDLDGVVLSHAHLDHWTDLEHLAIACRYVIGRRGVPVYAPAGLRELARPDDDGTLDWHLIGAQLPVNIGPFHLAFSPTDHPVPTLAMRIEAGGRVVGYSADTGPGWELSELGADLDLALCEATFLSDLEGSVQHLSARQAGRTSKKAGVRRLVITHMSPRIDKRAAKAEAESSFGAPVTVAAIGDRYVP
jgi:ribonuclease BN (tRNA processing enzyme)